MLRLLIVSVSIAMYDVYAIRLSVYREQSQLEAWERFGLLLRQVAVFSSSSRHLPVYVTYTDIDRPHTRSY